MGKNPARHGMGDIKNLSNIRREWAENDQESILMTEPG
jgi:hypothetical protein